METILEDDIFKCILLTEDNRILIQILLKFVPGVNLTTRGVN